MEILAGSLEWTQFDAEKLASFLDSETGKRFLPKLVEVAPPLLEDGTKTKILIRSGEVRGFQTVVKEIIALAHPAPPAPKQESEYPPLTADEKWNDGQTLERESVPQNPDPLAI
jgi:hypothetical protein